MYTYVTYITYIIEYYRYYILRNLKTSFCFLGIQDVWSLRCVIQENVTWDPKISHLTPIPTPSSSRAPGISSSRIRTPYVSKGTKSCRGGTCELVTITGMPPEQTASEKRYVKSTSWALWGAQWHDQVVYMFTPHPAWIEAWEDETERFFKKLQ